MGEAAKVLTSHSGGENNIGEINLISVAEEVGISRRSSLYSNSLSDNLSPARPKSA